MERKDRFLLNYQQAIDEKNMKSSQFICPKTH